MAKTTVTSTEEVKVDELSLLRALYKEDFTPEFNETPSIQAFDKGLKDLNKNTVKEFARILNLYKSWFIEQSMQIFPMDEAALNYRNGVVIEISKLIKTIESYAIERPDPIYRDKGQIKSGLEETNSKLLAA